MFAPPPEARQSLRQVQGARSGVGKWTEDERLASKVCRSQTRQGRKATRDQTSPGSTPDECVHSQPQRACVKIPQKRTVAKSLPKLNKIQVFEIHKVLRRRRRRRR